MLVFGVPPELLAQRILPKLSNLATKKFGELFKPTFTIVSESKIIVGLLKNLVMQTLLKRSTVTALHSSSFVPPALFAQTKFPEELYLTRNISLLPEFVNVVAPKVIVGLL